MEPHERVLADIDAAYLELCGQLQSIDDGDKLLKLRNLAETAVMHPCSRPKTIRIWEGEEVDNFHAAPSKKPRE